jgi:hypothetical protein
MSKLSHADVILFLFFLDENSIEKDPRMQFQLSSENLNLVGQGYLNIPFDI